MFNIIITMNNKMDIQNTSMSVRPRSLETYALIVLFTVCTSQKIYEHLTYHIADSDYFQIPFHIHKLTISTSYSQFFSAKLRL